MRHMRTIIFCSRTYIDETQAWHLAGLSVRPIKNSIMLTNRLAAGYSRIVHPGSVSPTDESLARLASWRCGPTKRSNRPFLVLKVNQISRSQIPFRYSTRSLCCVSLRPRFRCALYARRRRAGLRNVRRDRSPPSGATTTRPRVRCGTCGSGSDRLGTSRHRPRSAHAGCFEQVMRIAHILGIDALAQRGGQRRRSPIRLRWLRQFRQQPWLEASSKPPHL